MQINKFVAIPALVVATSAGLAACGSSASPYSQGKAWAIQDYKNGDIASAFTFTVVQAWCAKANPGEGVSWEKGCEAGYFHNHPSAYQSWFGSAPQSAPADNNAAPTPIDSAQAPAATAPVAPTPPPPPVTLACKLAAPGEGNAGLPAAEHYSIAPQGAVLSGGTPNTSPTVDVQFIVDPDGEGVYETKQQVHLDSEGHGTIWVNTSARTQIADGNVNGTVACTATVMGS
jgi:hypothetical protein